MNQQTARYLRKSANLQFA